LDTSPKAALETTNIINPASASAIGMLFLFVCLLFRGLGKGGGGRVIRGFGRVKV
jgi:hypothetical protein